jgi:hypothetical protein
MRDAVVEHRGHSCPAVRAQRMRTEERDPHPPEATVRRGDIGPCWTCNAVPKIALMGVTESIAGSVCTAAGPVALGMCSMGHGSVQPHATGMVLDHTRRGFVEPGPARETHAGFVLARLTYAMRVCGRCLDQSH